MQRKVFISTAPFGTVSDEPLRLLKEAGLEVRLNPYGRKMTEEEMIKEIADIDYLIAGTEQITPAILDAAKKLKLISRVGVGVDNIPFAKIAQRGIKAAYTPDAPTQAVAELVVQTMIMLLRNVHTVHNQLREGVWNKFMGNLLKGKTIGIIGAGRIGSTIVKLLQPFGVRILANDPVVSDELIKKYGVIFTTKEEVFGASDVVSLNLFYSPEVHHLINKKTLSLMKPGAFLINTARGMLVDEEDLFQALKGGVIKGAALDVFEQEPYKGTLRSLDNVILTPHIGAATQESRFEMEKGAATEVVRFDRGEPLLNEVYE